LTNVAALLKSDPSMAKKIKGIALMGGSVARGYGPDSKPEAEWNIKSNPEAAQAVFSSGVPLLMAPLDVTGMLQLDAAGRRRVFTHLTPLTNALRFSITSGAARLRLCLTPWRWRCSSTQACARLNIWQSK